MLRLGMPRRMVIRKVALAVSVGVLALLLASCERGICRYSTTGTISVKNGLLLIYEVPPGHQLSWTTDSAGEVVLHMSTAGTLPVYSVRWAPPTRSHAPRWAFVSYNQPAMITMGTASDHEWIINLFWPSGVITGAWDANWTRAKSRICRSGPRNPSRSQSPGIKREGETPWPRTARMRPTPRVPFGCL